ncbi:MAG TPA: hypothetical protein DFI00_10355 [Rhodospirillaceae bacterium]|nr:hypothetical protein [Alphaproteobacteria bacterium]OUT41007.1 MAG: hypothetical protein CBB62_01165 [Micavibrio sp. TMED2]HCI47684.1 hypothetical protein [Rhodospirillaceae bacterium]MAS47500.1 hypothetical protein [Alphaproteobacteria bacterium]MAX96627.1 hypothetical protein [Alphaproteobacteria bacterium]|tara:strand:+ start:648 stop:2192 length:1545 start_codon:yes stop_codon:yes gene_type:complete
MPARKIPFDRTPGQDALEITIVDDLKVVVPNDLSQMTPFVLLEQEDWFEDEIGFIRKLAQPGVNMLDIGANFGLYTLAMAKAIGGDGRFWAVEPASNTAGFLRRSVAANDFKAIEVLQMALSDSDGDGYLTIESSSELNALADGPGANTEQVKLSTLDKLMAEQFGDVQFDFMKIDAEGAESAILKGGKAFFEQQSPLVMYELKHRNQVNTQLIQQFADMGYEPYHLIPGIDVLVPFSLSDEIDGYKLNLFACKSDCADRLVERGFLLKSAEPGEAPAVDWDDYVAMQGWVVHAGLDFGPWVSGDALPEPDKQLRLALCHWGAAHKADASAADRYAHLKTAMELVSGIPAMNDSAAPGHGLIRLTASRITADLGNRVQRVTWLSDVLRSFSTGKVLINKPFLAVAERFDDLSPDGQLMNWLGVSLAETIDAKSRFSSFFTLPRDSYDIFKNLMQYPLLCAETVRRYMLCIQASGAKVDGGYPAGFKPVAEAAPDNRNPDLWRPYLAADVQQQQG